jgi:hypothetical protein
MSLSIVVNGKILLGKRVAGSRDTILQNFQAQVGQNFVNDFGGSLRRPAVSGLLAMTAVTV